MTSIDQLLQDAKDGAVLTVAESWSQGRTVFGGLSAGILTAAMLNATTTDRELQVLSVQFVGPLQADKPFKVVIVPLREGKNVSQIQGRLMQDEQVAVQAMAAFGCARESRVAQTPDSIALGEVPKKPTWVPQIPAVTPKFHQHIDLKIDQGGLPFTGSKDGSYLGWMRLREPPASFTLCHLVTLIDAWPPAVLQQLPLPAPASTLSWNMSFFQPLPSISGQQWLAYDCRTRQANGGYAHTDATICVENGTPLALSRQMITVFG